MSKIRELMRRVERLDGAGIVAARLIAALMWLANLHWKVPGDFGEDNGGGLYKYIASGAANAPFAPFRWAMREIVLPNFAAFGWFTLLSEIVVAALLLVGYRTRLVALAGAGLAIPIGLSVLYYPKADEWSWSYLLMIGLHLAIAANPRSGRVWGSDGVSAGSAAAARRSLLPVGIVTVVVGLLGWFVSRSADFAGRGVKLLGSDAGFVADGKLVRRWELKFLFFNPLWALLTIVLGALLIAAIREIRLAWVAAAGFGALALVALIQGHWDYLRDDGAVQRIASGTNVALWAGLAVAAAVAARRATAADRSHAGE